MLSYLLLFWFLFAGDLASRATNVRVSLLPLIFIVCLLSLHATRAKDKRVKNPFVLCSSCIERKTVKVITQETLFVRIL